MNNWISVDDDLPKNPENIVLVICLDDISSFGHPYTYKEAMSIAFYSSGKWWNESWAETVREDNIIHDVTHWMVLPKPPAR